MFGFIRKILNWQLNLRELQRIDKNVVFSKYFNEFVTVENNGAYPLICTMNGECYNYEDWNDLQVKGFYLRRPFFIKE